MIDLKILKQHFELFARLDDNELEEYAQSIKYDLIQQLFELRFNQDNIYDILYIIDNILL